MEGPRKVEVKEENGKFRLFVDGEPFYVKGAGLEFGDIEALAANGANSFRTWRTDNGQDSAIDILDKALANNLMVLMGIEFGRERHGFDYSDTAWVSKQKEDIRAQVLALKDHPALLGWGIGNELNLHAENMKVWDAVNDVAKMIHEIDGNHPATTMLAGIGKNTVDYIAANCPDLDFLSVQFYGDIENLATRLSESGYTGPYLVTEWGATGHWEVAKTEWGAPIELTSTEKAKSFKHRYENVILADSINCMGSYVFLWGQKQERTPTWYGLFSEKNETNEAIDVMAYEWTGKWPEHLAPTIVNASIEGLGRYDNIKLKAEKTYNAQVEYLAMEQDSCIIDIEIMHESTDLKDGGDFETRPKVYFQNTIKDPAGKLTIVAPSEKGAFRLFFYVRDGKNKVGTINIPFLVE
jgi:hypothetical protein